MVGIMARRAKKRGLGEGSIFQRSEDGRWVGKITIGWRDGRQVFKRVTGKRREEVEERLQQARLDRDRGRLVGTREQTVEQFISHWLAEIIAPRLSPTTYRWYEHKCRLHIVPRIGHFKLEQLTPVHVRTMVNELAREISPQAAAGVHRTLRAALSEAVRSELIDRNVAKLVTPPRVATKEQDFFTDQEAMQLLKAVRGERLEALYQLAITLGMRQGEILALRWEDLDFDQGIIHVRHTLVRAEGRFHFKPPKSMASQRTLVLPLSVRSALREHRARQSKARVVSGLDLVFPTTTGGPYHAKELIRDYDLILQRAGLRRIKFHGLRHTAASIMLRKKFSAGEVAQILGHSSEKLVQDTYGHVMPRIKYEVADRMNELLA